VYRSPLDARCGAERVAHRGQVRDGALNAPPRIPGRTQLGRFGPPRSSDET